ncbi:MAG TPA: hypothetical protein VFV05_06205 [Methylomirabilota bacterium]|nr:hypothetical protein [Methylomirabilota bacterium]
MGTLSLLATHRQASSGRSGARPPTLRLALKTGDPATDAALGVVSIEVRVSGGRAPVRLYLYVNGDLAETWSESVGLFDLSLDEYGPGRHAVTARAVDATGRWAGASMVVACAAAGMAGNE